MDMDKFNEINKIIGDAGIDKEKKLQLVKDFFEEQGIVVPKGICVCIVDTNDSVGILPTANVDRNTPEFRRFALQMSLYGNHASNDLREQCSGTYFKQD